MGGGLVGGALVGGALVGGALVGGPLLGGDVVVAAGGLVGAFDVLDGAGSDVELAPTSGAVPPHAVSTNVSTSAPATPR